MGSNTVWIDIDNPPQVQYLSPFVGAFVERGHRVEVTARDHGMALGLLRLHDVAFVPIGRQPGAGRFNKVMGTLQRAWVLRKHMRRCGGAAALLCGSRSGVLAARLMGIPAFVIIDYEHVELDSYRRLGATVLFPNVIGTDTFRNKGFDADRAIAFSGLKEDLSFAGKILKPTQPAELKHISKGMCRVLLRPPAEDSHYFSDQSRHLFKAAVRALAPRSDVQAVFAPRRPEQRSLVQSVAWANAPIVLERPVPFIDLLGSVDCVVCSGGTMLREAAYLGVPAVGVFAGTTGRVDAYLASLGAVRLIRNAAELERIDWRMPKQEGMLVRNPSLIDEIVSHITRAAGLPTDRLGTA